MTGLKSHLAGLFTVALLSSSTASAGAEPDTVKLVGEGSSERVTQSLSGKAVTGIKLEATPATQPATQPGKYPGDLGRGLMVYLKTGKSLTQLQAELAPKIKPTTVHANALVYQDDIPLAGISETVANDVVYIGEVPVPDFGDDPIVRNEDAADAHQVREAATKHSVSGDGLKVAVWDGGRVRTSHNEFRNGRAQQVDAPQELSTHATHVCGTIGAHGDPAIGGRAQARGMAPQVRLSCYDWDNDIGEMSGAAAAGVVCSNHSYGPIRGWYRHPQYGWMWWGNPQMSAQEDGMFGRYDGQAYQFDRLVADVPTLTVFMAAGNDRDDAPPGASTEHWVRPTPGAAWGRSTAYRQADGALHGGYDTISGGALAKNVVTIGAIEDMTIDPPSPDNIRVCGFSSWGPTDEGRVKPDLVANGALLESPTAAGDDKYQELSGTSMATPAATGIGALLAECFAKYRERTPTADELKAVLIHTAMSPNPGPSAQIGWGSIRADDAADVVADVNGTKSILLRKELSAPTGVFTWRGKARAGQPLRATLVWIDPPPETLDASRPINDPSSVLVHDLNLVLVSNEPNPSTRHPWVLQLNRGGGSGPVEAAVQQVNSVDNVERVDVPVGQVPPDSSWTVTVSASNLARNQAFALVISGLEQAER